MSICKYFFFTFTNTDRDPWRFTTVYIKKKKSFHCPVSFLNFLMRPAGKETDQKISNNWDSNHDDILFSGQNKKRVKCKSERNVNFHAKINKIDFYWSCVCFVLTKLAWVDTPTPYIHKTIHYIETDVTKIHDNNQTGCRGGLRGVYRQLQLLKR